MHLYGPGSSSWPAAGEGVDEASYHGTPACSPKLIQSVPDQTEEKAQHHSTPKTHDKRWWSQCFHAECACRRSVADTHQQ